MDNKITKKRLSDFLSYEWILMIITIVAAILVLELVFTVSGVTLTKGQAFVIGYDMGDGSDGVEITSDAQVNIYNGIKKSNCFSYDVIDVGFMRTESREGETDLLSLRYSTYDLDVLVTFNDKSDTENRMKDIIDNYEVWSFEDMVKKGKTYLKQFLKQTDGDWETAVLEYSNLSESKIEEYFLTRQKKDNRFRTQEQKEEGKKNECLRIKKLCEDIVKIEYLLENHSEIFIKYTKYEQLSVQQPDNTLVQDLYKNQTLKSYAIDLSALNGGKTQVSSFFNRNGSVEKLVLLGFEFADKQPDLRFETLSFMNYIVEECSNVF